ncbi:DUF4153 domain-containing protein [Reichenbachiella agarivorans]|uniref:DUF4153 domain-containing protein n=1 Tax=Reichenbachiella agarivorans TaxID=2979464 RepID=A0ABY6CSH8_9BACT|nr:DUF4153 domain-containing protein [Reichenbachiella agarivorans]UXP33470.1 DUF4153 domain-containing protein [Reichenbachiella agarivorans]
MNIPSLKYLWHKMLDGFLRFPLTIVSSAIGCAVAIYLTEKEFNSVNILPYVNVLLTCVMGIPLFFCVSILTRHYQFDRVKTTLAWIISILFLGLIFYSLPSTESTHNTSVPYIRYVIYNLAIHLLVSFIPFLTKGHVNGFWNYNLHLFIRFLTSLVYSGFLYTGLCMALLSLNLLFNIDIDEKLYFELYILVQGLFNTWFFVSGVDADFSQLDTDRSYPLGLKIFTQYILMPLLVLYLIILYGYGFKIIVSWDWPKGIVAYLISCVAVLGIFNLLLMYPYSKIEAANYWIKRFSKVYYYTLIPLILLLFIAIYLRIGDYGITVNRYILVLLGIWLSIVTVYFISGRENIKFIPISLTLVLVITSFGPWGIFSWSERSQVNRLKKYLEENGILENGKIINEITWIPDSTLNSSTGMHKPSYIQLPDSIHNEIISIVQYLDDYHGFKQIRPWYKQNVDSLMSIHEQNLTYTPDEGNKYLEIANLDPYYQYPNEYLYFHFSRNTKEWIDTKNYDKMLLVECSIYDNQSCVSDYHENNTVNNQVIVNSDTTIPLKIVLETDTLNISMTDLLLELMHKHEEKQYNLPISTMMLDYQQDNHDLKIIFNQIRLNGDQESIQLNQLDFILLYRYL